VLIHRHLDQLSYRPPVGSHAPLIVQPAFKLILKAIEPPTAMHTEVNYSSHA